MKCEEIGTLRAFLDGELSDEDCGRTRRHVDDCTRCRRKLDELQKTADLTARALTSLGDLQSFDRYSEARALARHRQHIDRHRSGSRRNGFGKAFGRLTMTTKSFSLRYRVAVGGIAALLVLALIGLTPQGQVAASNFLAQFRVQKLKVVSVDPQEMSTVINELSHFGQVDASQFRSNLYPASSVAEATQRAGFAVREPKALPSSVSGEPRIMVKPSSTLTFTLDAARAQTYLTSVGEKDFSIPSKFDGAKLSLNMPPGVLLVYGEGGSRTLLIGQAGAPSGDVIGNVTPQEIRDILLRLPGLSQEMVSQLMAMDDWTNTLPVPLPKGQANWHEVDLAGGKGLAVGDNTGMGGFVVWQADGIVYGVGGQFSEQVLLTVAKSLR